MKHCWPIHSSLSHSSWPICQVDPCHSFQIPWRTSRLYGAWMIWTSRTESWWKDRRQTYFVGKRQFFTEQKSPWWSKWRTLENTANEMRVIYKSSVDQRIRVRKRKGKGGITSKTHAPTLPRSALPLALESTPARELAQLSLLGSWFWISDHGVSTRKQYSKIELVIGRTHFKFIERKIHLRILSWI